jgi:hypothetical protein
VIERAGVAKSGKTWKAGEAPRPLAGLRRLGLVERRIQLVKRHKLG